MPFKHPSLSNISRDSGLGFNKTGHSRNVSDASTATAVSTASQYDEESRLFKGTTSVHRVGSVRIFFYFIGIIVMTIGFLIGGLYYPLIRGMIQDVIKIEEGGEFYNFWIRSSAPTEVGLYFFHIENPWAVENGLEKLRVREHGKFYFKQIFERDIHNYKDDKRIVNFTEHRYFIFDEEKTKLSLDDNITVVNVPYAALGSIIPKYVSAESIPFFGSAWSHLGYRSINTFLERHEQELFINTTIRELIYGYKLDFLDTAMSYSGLLKNFGIEMKPSKFLPNNSFGILNGRNGTPDGPYEMFTGVGGTHDQFGIFKSWNGLKKLDMWRGDTCNMINGTDGTIWPAGVKKTDRLHFFIPDVCRSLYLTYFEDSSYKGIPTQIFSIPDEVLAGSRTNPDNACFCMEDDPRLIEERCTLDGVFDASICQDDVPIIISLPHFMNADKRITDNIVGLKPDEKLHRPELHVEPLMGALIFGDSRLQMSIRIPKNEDLSGFDKLKHDLYVPIFWGYKKLGMSDEMAAELQWRLFFPYKLLSQSWLFIAFAGFAIVIATAAHGLILFQRKKDDKMSSKRKLNLSYAVCAANKHNRDSCINTTKYTNLSVNPIDATNNSQTRLPRTESNVSDLGVSVSPSNSLLNIESETYENCLMGVETHI